MSGFGTLSNPYQIDHTDALGLSLIRLNPELLAKYLPLLIKNLNSKLQSISFAKFLGQIQDDLKDILEVIDNGN